MLKYIVIVVIIQTLNSSQEIQIQKASSTELPWMVYYEVKGKRCGGAMIDDTHVLTAAHCFDRVKYSEFQNLRKLREAVKIRIGEWQTETDPDCGDDVSDEICDTTADILPKEVIIHESYNKRHQDKRFAYDIAIITLAWPPRRSEVINVLRLENPDRCHDSISGEFWKTTGFGGETSVKKRMEMVLLTHEECVRSIDESHLGKLNETVHVCGRDLNGEKTCNGDAGNPVTNVFEGVPYLQGIVTFTDEDECVATETNTASVFLRVPCFYDWIHSKVPNIEYTGSIKVYSSTSTPRPVTKQTTIRPSWRSPVTQKSVTTTSKPDEPTTEDERIHFLKGNDTNDAGFDVRVGDVGHDKDEEETTSTAQPSRFSRPQKIVRTSAKPVEYDDHHTTTTNPTQNSSPLWRVQTQSTTKLVTSTAKAEELTTRRESTHMENGLWRLSTIPEELTRPITTTTRSLPNFSMQDKNFYSISNEMNCGQTIIGRQAMHGGTYVRRGNYPWHAAIIHKREYKCGATVISKNSVITAAHCVKGKHASHEFLAGDILVTLGVHDLSDPFERGRVTFGVKSINVHHDWNMFLDPYDADIALLVLEKEIVFDSFIQPICLAGAGSVVSNYTSGTIIGFGRSENKDLEDVAKVLDIPIIDFHECSKSEKHRHLLSARTFCGGTQDGRGVCDGDSGGGVYVAYNNRAYLRGIISASLSEVETGCNVNKHAVFTEATGFYEWIKNGGKRYMNFYYNQYGFPSYYHP